jgi:hypothetical protein
MNGHHCSLDSLNNNLPGTIGTPLERCKLYRRPSSHTRYSFFSIFFKKKSRKSAAVKMAPWVQRWRMWRSARGCGRAPARGPRRRRRHVRGGGHRGGIGAARRPWRRGGPAARMPPPPSQVARWPANNKRGPRDWELWKRWRRGKEEKGELTTEAKEVAAAAMEGSGGGKEMVAGEWRLQSAGGYSR